MAKATITVICSNYPWCLWRKDGEIIYESPYKGPEITKCPECGEDAFISLDKEENY